MLQYNLNEVYIKDNDDNLIQTIKAYTTTPTLMSFNFLGGGKMSKSNNLQIMTDYKLDNKVLDFGGVVHIGRSRYLIKDIQATKSKVIGSSGNLYTITLG